MVRRVLRRAVNAALILLAVAYLTIFGLILAERGRLGLPTQPLQAAGEALLRTGQYVLHHPQTYYWHRQNVPAAPLVLTSFANSAALLLLALTLAAAIGVPLGVLAGTRQARRRGHAASVVLLFSILGVSTPSFLLAMLLWVLALRISRYTGLPALPATGYGWDKHVILPALVLAARPLAQIVQVTYVTLTGVLAEDYVRTARSKGLGERWVLLQHVLRNVRIPVLTTLGTSLRFALASLPVVEFFFNWPGLGLTALQAIEAGNVALVVDLAVALGLLFILLNWLLDLLYPLLDPRQRANGDTQEQTEERASLREQVVGLGQWLVSLPAALRRRAAPPSRPPWSGLNAARQPDFTAATPVASPDNVQVPGSEPGISSLQLPGATRARRDALGATLGNFTLVAGTLLVLAFLSLALFGDRLAAANPYQTHGVMTINGKIGAPPYPPSAVFPWGSDQVGRDVQALVLAGGKRTLALALAAAVARVLIGTLLGGLAGWWQRGRLDQLVTGAVAVWAAFPATIFAMILIQALGIQQGMWVFVVALCVVGWGEIAQFVRAQALASKPLPYVESARAAGARVHHVLLRHVLPNMLPALVVLLVLEIGGVLMLLAELGFLNVFMGGGFRAEITAGATGSGLVYYFSDVPEWGALLANVRNWWRGYPWLAWYPGVFFFLAILAFNVWGEGLRRFLDETRFNVVRVFNRYAALAGALGLVALYFVWQTTGPLGLYASQARQFDAQAALADIRALAGRQFAGRETGRPGTEQAAQYIADRMAAVGLFPAGENNAFLQAYPCPRTHLAGRPRLSITGPAHNDPLIYRQDFAEFIGRLLPYGRAQAPVVGVALGPPPTATGLDPYGLARFPDLRGKVLLMREERATHPNGAAGELIITTNPAHMQQRLLFHREGDVAGYAMRAKPVLYVSEGVAERLLAAMGSSLAQFDRTIADQPAGGVAMIGPGPEVALDVPAQPADPENSDEQCYNVIGVLPGTGALQRQANGESLDSQVIIVSAYYDGLGQGPGGALYPGANDNASSVAAMLEIARVLKHGAYAPTKTVVFVAWTEGERGKPLMVSDIMNAKVGFNLLRPEAVIELSGLGGGRGGGLALGQGSSYRLVQLMQRAAGRMGVATTTRGRDPHFGMPPAMPFGTRSALTAYVSWDGSDRLAHTLQDTVDAIAPQKLQAAGQAVLLAVTVLSREVNY